MILTEKLVSTMEIELDSLHLTYLHKFYHCKLKFACPLDCVDTNDNRTLKSTKPTIQIN